MISKKERQERQIRKDALGEICRLLLDVIKLIIAGVVLVAIMDLSIDNMILLSVSTLVIVLLLLLWYKAFIFYKRKE